MNPQYKLFALISKYSRLSLIMVAMLSVVSMTMTGAQQQNALCAVYGVYTTVQTAIFILGIMLMILGAALYAGANLMPAQSRGQVQGYGMGMLMGGVVGVIIAILAPFILTTIAGKSFTTNIANTAASC